MHGSDFMVSKMTPECPKGWGKMNERSRQQMKGMLTRVLRQLPGFPGGRSERFFYDDVFSGVESLAYKLEVASWWRDDQNDVDIGVQYRAGAGDELVARRPFLRMRS